MGPFYKNPFNYGVNISYGQKLFDGKVSFVVTAAHDESYLYNQGVYQILEFGFGQQELRITPIFNQKLIIPH